MRVVAVTRRPPGVERKTFARRPAHRPLAGDVVLVDVKGRQPVAVQLVLPPRLAPFDAMAAAMGRMHWDDASNNGPRGGGRLAGFTAPHRTFGWAPPQVLRQRYATTAAMHDEAALANALSALGAAVWPWVAQHLPVAAGAHQRAVQAAVADRWRLSAGWFTSGIVNRSVALPYHRDAGNLRGCLSAMVAWRHQVGGGALHLPEYDTWLAVPDRALVVFNGATVLHGVTPLSVRPGGWRYTAVWYVRAGLARSAPTWEAEMARAQLHATSHDHVPA